MRSFAPSRHRRATLALLVVLAPSLGAAPSRAEERVVPVARVTIYPGDRIDESMLDEQSFSIGAVPEGVVIERKSALIGKVARRTLLPGRPIAPIAVDNPRVVAIGAQVRIVFVENGLVITAYGAAMQAGAIGDLIRVRNQDSGLMVTGRIQPDGSIRVSEG